MMKQSEPSDKWNMLQLLIFFMKILSKFISLDSENVVFSSSGIIQENLENCLAISQHTSEIAIVVLIGAAEQKKIKPKT